MRVLLRMSKRLRFCRHPVSKEYVEELEDRVRVLENTVFGCVKR